MVIERLLITGGHPTPALAVIDEIKKTDSHVKDVLFVGRRYVNNSERNNSFEYQEVTARKVPFIHFDAARGFFGLLQLPVRVIQSLIILSEYRPNAILSFGGYLSVPICVAAAVKRVPIFLHEQTLRPGRANRMLSSISRKVMISFPQTAEYFDKKKVILTGNPVREALKNSPRDHKFSSLRGPIIFINGGNLGSHSVNTHIFKILPNLVSDYTVIHQVGNIQEYGDWEYATELQLALPRKHQERYLPFHHLSTLDIAAAYKYADAIVCRSGANTIMELIALAKPAVLIPLPWSAFEEQRFHAKLLSDAGVCELFEQSGSGKQLMKSIQKVISNVQSYIHRYESLTHFYIPEAASLILETLTKDKTPKQRK